MVFGRYSVGFQFTHGQLRHAIAARVWPSGERPPKLVELAAHAATNVTVIVSEIGLIAVGVDGGGLLDAPVC